MYYLSLGESKKYPAMRKIMPKGFSTALEYSVTALGSIC